MARPWQVLTCAIALAALAPAASAAAADPAAPPGYHHERDTRPALVGKIVFLGSYAIAAMVPFAVLGGEVLTGGNVNQPPVASVLPNFIPIAGPFLTLSTSGVHGDPGSVFYTKLSIPGQLLGAAIWLYGVTTTRTRLVPDGPSAAVTAAPTGDGGFTLTLVGRF